MTGLKSGSGDDLWDDETPDDGKENADTPETVSPDEEEQIDETSDRRAESGSRNEIPATEQTSAGQEQPYIVRRAIQDKSVQFERDERLTFFVHDDVMEGERELLTELESEFGRDIPKFDVREAVYRAALQNRDDVLNELIEMGYSLSSE